MNYTAVSRVLFICLASLAPAQAATTYVWENPTTYVADASNPASGLINYSNKTTGNVAPGATSQATLEALSSLHAIHDWTMGGTAWATSGLGSNYGVISYTDATLPDIQFSCKGSAGVSQSGNQINNSSFSTGGTSLRLAPNVSSSVVTASLTLTIDFGDWDGTTFDSSANGVSAVGFMLASTRFPTLSALTVTFLDADGNALSTQSLSNFSSMASTSIAYYFGYETTGAAISSVEIALTGSYASGNGTILGLDDLAFTTVVPEPSPIALALVAGLLLLVPARRMCRKLGRA